MQTNNIKETELTPAQKLGYKVGDLFEVIEDASYSCKGMIVKFDTDDNSTFHWFTYESGPKATFTDSVNEVAINIFEIKPYKQEQVQFDTQSEVQPVYSLDEIKAVMLYAGFIEGDVQGLQELLIEAKKDSDFLAFIKSKQKYEPD
jgi:hypothetical protein